MKTMRAGNVLGLSVLALTGMAALPVPQDKPAAPVWETDFETARTTARQTNKPLFVIFR